MCGALTKVGGMNNELGEHVPKPSSLFQTPLDDLLTCTICRVLINSSLKMGNILVNAESSLLTGRTPGKLLVHPNSSGKFSLDLARRTILLGTR